MDKFKNSETGSEFTIKEVKDMISVLITRGRGLNNWEDSFIKSIEKQFNKMPYISEKQLIILERIYSEKTRL